MSALLITVHIIVCIALIMIVLLQTGKGADMGAAFGGGGSQTLFGSTGASSFLSRATTVAAIIFMLTCLTLAYNSSHKTGSSIMKDVKVPAPEQAQPETAPSAEKTESAPSASPLQTSVETKAAGEKDAAKTEEVSGETAPAAESSAAEPVPASESSASPETDPRQETPETAGDKPQTDPAAAPLVTEEGKTEPIKPE